MLYEKVINSELFIVSKQRENSITDVQNEYTFPCIFSLSHVENALKL